MDKETVSYVVDKYPKLLNFADSGTVSLKAARTILGIDKWLMYEIFVDLLGAGAVNQAGAASWRATADFRSWLTKRRNEIDV